MEILEKGTKIYYNGDMANSDGFGVISEVKDSGWGVNYQITMEDGRDINVSHTAFSPEYSGNGSTRFVTEQAYEEYRERKWAECQAWATKVNANY